MFWGTCLPVLAHSCMKKEGLVGWGPGLPSNLGLILGGFGLWQECVVTLAKGRDSGPELCEQSRWAGCPEFLCMGHPGHG
jgi:hypothetical protein